MKKLSKKIHTAYILNKLYINGVYATLESYFQLSEAIKNKKPYTLEELEKNKINILF